MRNYPVDISIVVHTNANRRVGVNISIDLTGKRIL